MPVIMLGGALPGPDSISGLTLWLDAEATIYSDAGTTPAVDGATVQQWNDRSGLGNNFSQGTSGNRPTYKTNILNGRPVVRFGGATDDDWLESTVNSSSFFAAGAKTMFVVAKHSANATACVIGNQQRDHIYFEYETTGTQIVANNYDGTSDNAIKGGLSSGTWYILTYLHSSGNLYSGASDTRTASMATVASGNTGMLDIPMTIAKRTNASPQWFDGDIAEVVFYNVALTEANRQVVERYLAAKYSITLPY